MFEKEADGNWWGEGQLCQPPYAWKEIVLPEPPKYWNLSTGENNINKEDE